MLIFAEATGQDCIQLYHATRLLLKQSLCGYLRQSEVDSRCRALPDLLLQVLLGLCSLQQLLVLLLTLSLVLVPVSLHPLHLPAQPLLGIVQGLHRLGLLSLHTACPASLKLSRPMSA